MIPRGPVAASNLDSRIDANAERAFAFLERLVAEPSIVGTEQSALGVLAAELDELGFQVEHQVIPPGVASAPGAGVPQTSYDGRYNLVGRRSGAASGPSLLLNGHIDVVPATEPALWTTPPFAPTRRDGWLYGRGAGDMKCGFAMGVLAIRSLLETDPAWLDGPLGLVAAIEEESTGNGTLASAMQDVLADAVVILEPTDLGLLLGGVGVLWLEVTVHGRPAHAGMKQDSVNPIEAAIPLLAALRDLERDLNASERDPRLESPDPFALNIGRFSSGDWPSTVPSVARFELRLGYPMEWNPGQAEARVVECLMDAARTDPWLAANPPVVRPTGFRAEGYMLPADAPLVRRMAAAHAHAHGTPPRTFSLASTTDARTYLNHFGVPAVCYGPRTTAIHGIDEGVELASIVDGARTLARFLADWYAPGWSGT